MPNKYKIMYSYMRYFISIFFIACSLACKIRLPMKRQFTEWKKNVTFPSVISKVTPPNQYNNHCLTQSKLFMGLYMVVILVGMS